MRLFTAITLPENIIQTLSRFSHGMQNCRWVDESQLHLTLNFIEEYDNLPFLVDSLTQIEAESFNLSLNGCGFFPRKKGGTLWAGVGQSTGLTDLQQKLVSLLQKNDIPFDNKEFKPHITLGRIKGRYNDRELRAFLENGLFLESEPFMVSQFSLFSSELFPDGPRYTEEGSFSLSS